MFTIISHMLAILQKNLEMKKIETYKTENFSDYLSIDLSKAYISMD